MAVTWYSVVYRLFLIELVLGMRFYVWFKCHGFMSVLRCACVNVCTRSSRNGNKEDKIILKLQLLHRRLLFYRYFNGLVVIKFGACVRFKFSFFSLCLFFLHIVLILALAQFFMLFLIRLSHNETMIWCWLTCMHWLMYGMNSSLEYNDQIRQKQIIPSNHNQIDSTAHFMRLWTD